MEHARDIYEAYIDSDSYFQESRRQPKIPLERLHRLKEQYHMNEEEYNEVEDIVLAASSAGEMQGFINGMEYLEKTSDKSH